MNLHEYQAKLVLRSYGAAIPDFGVASSLEEAKKIVEELNLDEAVVKIQVHAGGRGKAGGVKFAKGTSEILQAVKLLIGMRMVNSQTGKEGLVAHQVLISLPVDIEKEYYLAALIDREKGEAILIASPEGGVDIEEMAVRGSEHLLQLPFPFETGLDSLQMTAVIQFMGWHHDPSLEKQGEEIIRAVINAFKGSDATLVEINPLVLTKEQRLMAVDAKISIDDNALFRHPDLAAYYDPTQESIYEVMAREKELSYVSLKGNIGCMVNGAGLAMATMDIIDFYGGAPANFLDVGGSASKEKVVAGFKIILKDPSVKAILINIFGGIMNCATIAEGIIAAAREINIQVPLIVRMEGTNVDKGRYLLKESGLRIITADDLADAAQKAVIATTFR